MDLVAEVRKRLKENINEKTVSNAQDFFKEKILFYGVKMSMVSIIARDTFEVIRDLPRENIYAFCEELWKSGYIEEASIAGKWSYAARDSYMKQDILIFEKWIYEYVTNWASCDTLCNHTIGDFLMMYPEEITRLKQWAISHNRWLKRAASVSLIIPARKGMFLDDIFEIADILLLDKDDLVQKGYGWMLKAASEAHQKQVFDYVVSKKAIMPRTAYRYALEKMPKDLKEIAMKK